MLLYSWVKSDIIDNITRNNAHKYAWQVVRWGGLVVYGPVSVLWPFSFFGSQGVTDLYKKVWAFQGRLGTTLHLVVAVMFWYAMRMYLYEENLSSSTVKLEFYTYFLTIYVFFWYTTQPLLLPFNQFYTMNKITLEDL